MTRPDERAFEAPVEDATEQATPANPVDVPDELSARDDVNEYDALEQERVVELEDDYR